MIECRDVTKVYQQGRQVVRVLAGISLRIEPGEFVSIMGRSGSGKSTLLHLLGGLDVPTSGQVLFEGQDLDDLSDRQRSHLRRSRIGFVFQFFNLLPSLSAVENVALPLSLAGQCAKATRQLALEALERVRLGHRACHFPEEMSGGEMQRVAVARALVADPDVVLCDEPTGNLDGACSREVLALLRSLPEAGRRSVVMVTHDPQAANLADRVIHIQDGKLCANSEGRKADVYAVSHA
jgi:putative ABC transport system ATP-binding protein